MDTPFATATAQVRRMIPGSPPWKPQAMFAHVTISSSASSSPRLQRPSPSPMSVVNATRVDTRSSCARFSQSRTEYRHQEPIRTAPVSDENPSVGLPCLWSGDVELRAQRRTHRLDGRVAPARAAHQRDECPLGAGVCPDEVSGPGLRWRRELRKDARGSSLSYEEKKKVQVPELVLDRRSEPSSETVLDCPRP